MDFSIFESIEKPSRYLGQEINSVKKKWDEKTLKIALSYPDLYEVGMSHMGLPILYHYLNKMEGVIAERVFSPGKDFEFILRKNKIPLFSLENKKPVREFDILGFSLLSELTYTNILNILELSGIEILSKEREETSPIIFAGGVNIFNPEPLVPFIDVFYIGDAEANFFKVVEKIRNMKIQGVKREEIIESLMDEIGIYIPKLYSAKKTKHFIIPDLKKKIKKAYLKNLDLFPLPENPIVPNTEIIFDRLSVEIARGCPQRCRFCQASFVYHPFRWRDPDYLINYIEKTVKGSGFEDFSLSSLSTTDYPHIEKLMFEITKRLENDKVGMGLPSLRPGMIKEFMLELIRKTRKTGFTIVPEAGTERLRKVINKYVNDEEVFNALETAYKYGWRAVKFYFMIGLPTETEEDIEGIANILLKAFSLGRKFRRKIKIGATISVFIPKPHTPFQWLGFAKENDIKRRKEHLLERIKNKREIFLKFHPYKTTFVETLLSRGDRRVGKIIYNAFKLGARFDAWDSEFNFKIWERAIEESEVDISPFLSELTLKEELPWDHIDTGIKKEYLIDEFMKSKREERTQSCIERDCDECRGCVLPVKIIKEKEIKKDFNFKREENEHKQIRYIISYKKTGQSVFLSSLETVRAIERTLRRTPINFTFTEGFHPKIKISFLFADPLGVEIEEDIFEIRSKDELHIGDLRELNKKSVKGIEFFKMLKIKENSPRLSKIVDKIVFTVDEKELIENFNEEEILSDFPEFISLENKKGKIFFTFIYDAKKKFAPYKMFKTIMKNYSPFKIKKHKIIVKEEFLELI